MEFVTCLWERVKEDRSFSSLHLYSSYLFSYFIGGKKISSKSACYVIAYIYVFIWVGLFIRDTSKT